MLVHKKTQKYKSGQSMIVLYYSPGVPRVSLEAADIQTNEAQKNSAVLQQFTYTDKCRFIQRYNLERLKKKRIFDRVGRVQADLRNMFHITNHLLNILTGFFIFHKSTLINHLKTQSIRKQENEQLYCS